MNSHEASYRQILKSSSIIGGASVFNILISLIRTKVVAIMMGPAGVGVIGLLTNIMGTASAIAGLGFGTVGTRQIAEAAGQGDLIALASARRALFWGTATLAIFGAILVFILRTPIAFYVVGDNVRANEVGWLGLGVALTVASASQGALLNGLRKIEELALISVFGAIGSCLVGLGALWIFGEGGILAFIIIAPLSSFILGIVFISRLPRISEIQTRIQMLKFQLISLAKLGFAFMLAGLASSLAQLFVRTLIKGELGTAHLGYFQASWSISMTYIGFVLGAMGTDFYPRLTALISDNHQTNQLVNEQTDIAILLSGPVLILMLSLAPFIIKMLYADSFGPAASILRWQILGDVLKVTSWPLGFIILAKGDGYIFMFTECSSAAIFGIISALGLPYFGIEAVGIAFLAMYIYLLPLVYYLARRNTNFSWEKHVVSHIVQLLIAIIIVFILGWRWPLLGAWGGSVLAVIFAIRGITKLSRMAKLSDPINLIKFKIRNFFN